MFELQPCALLLSAFLTEAKTLLKTIRFTVKSHHQTELIDITREVQAQLTTVGFTEGLCMLYVPHTTAAIMINENADPSVCSDILMILNRIVPWEADYRHLEGNSPAHVKATLVGESVTIAVSGGVPSLGRWQGIFFCEFDGPRTRTVSIHLL